MAGLLIIHLGIIHFYLMEIDQKIVLQVRPFALITFVFAGLGVANLVCLDKFLIKVLLLIKDVLVRRIE